MFTSIAQQVVPDLLAMYVLLALHVTFVQTFLALDVCFLAWDVLSGIELEILIAGRRRAALWR